MTKRSATDRTTKPATDSEPSLGLMGFELMLYSWETMAHRALMIATGTCPPAEYLKMVDEKATAIVKASQSLATRGSHDLADLLAPFHAAAKANAIRLARR